MIFWADRVNRVAGVTLLLLAILVILAAVMGMIAQGDANPLSRGDINDLLRKTNDNQSAHFVALALSIAVDAAVSLAAAVLVYPLFSGRSRVLALFAAAGLLANAIAWMAADGANLTLGVLAADFVEEGGAGAIAAGDPVILQSARAVAAFSGFAILVASTAMAFGFLSLGSLLAWAPRGEVNPPRWLGGLAILSAIGVLLGWITPVEAAAGMVFASIGYVASVVFLIILGAWLVARPEAEARPATA